MARAEFRRRRVQSEAALRDLREQSDELLGNRRVGERAKTSCWIAAYGDEKPTTPPGHLPERSSHLLLAPVVVSRGHQPLHCIGADDECDAGKQARLFDERWRPRQLHRGLAGELSEAAAYFIGREGGLVHVGRRQLEVNGG